MMVAPNPQLRHPPSASLRDRWKMLTLACESSPVLEPSRFEDGRTGPTRTVQTLKDLSKTNDLPIVWAIGMDAFRNVSKWYQAQELPKIASFFVLSRTDPYPSKLPGGFCSVEEPSQLLNNPGGVFVSSEPMLDISGTEIRERIRSGLDASDWLHPQVSKHIIKNHLYRG